MRTTNARNLWTVLNKRALCPFILSSALSFFLSALSFFKYPSVLFKLQTGKFRSKMPLKRQGSWFQRFHALFVMDTLFENQSNRFLLMRTCCLRSVRNDQFHILLIMSSKRKSTLEEWGFVQGPPRKKHLSKKKHQRPRDTKSASAIRGEKADRGSCLTVRAVHCNVLCVRSTGSRLTMVLFLGQWMAARPSDLIK